MTRYDYKELRDKAIETGKEADVWALAEWMERYGYGYWNGECWDIDDGKTLWPILRENEDGDCNVVNYEIR